MGPRGDRRMLSGNQPPRKAQMHSFKPPRSVGRWAPLTAALLGSAFIAGPAYGQGAAAPTATVTYNTADVLLESVGGTGVVSVTRGGHELATGTADGVAGEF